MVVCTVYLSEMANPSTLFSGFGAVAPSRPVPLRAEVQQAPVHQGQTQSGGFLRNGGGGRHASTLDNQSVFSAFLRDQELASVASRFQPPTSQVTIAQKKGKK